MTKEEGLGLNATVHLLNPQEMRVIGDLHMKGIERLISLKRFNVDRMVTVYFNPSQKIKRIKGHSNSKE